ncbi:hypothetical protein UR09_03785 [Candidatus Nitromaritima sp. SCGC AAA799-A02]|nr:hypothetical protein UR09_03785 [Candidatus Nitromaritima sp. SCGC AAA799-A02]KMP12191.1 hypothetical protein UZ36_01890 [Candidatus Nitromaritima sp. SCGC AAA799-C22]
MDYSANKNPVGEGNPTEKFWRMVPDAIHDEQSLFFAVDSYLTDFRITIDDNTETARSIDNKESWGKIKSNAKKEGYNSFAEAIEFIDSIWVD